VAEGKPVKKTNHDHGKVAPGTSAELDTGDEGDHHDGDYGDWENADWE